VAITKAALLTAIAEDLNDFGEWNIDPGRYIERHLLNAIDDVWKAQQWAFRIGSSTITVTSGTSGPYDVPADFDGLVTSEKVNKYFAYDAYGVPPPIPDGANGQRFPITFDRVLNKINFLVDPGTGTKTFYYLKRLTTLDLALAALPDSVALKKILISRTSHYALVNSEDFASQAKTYWEQSEMLLDREWKRVRKGSSRPDTRTTLGASGNPIYYGFQTGDE